MGSRPEEGVGRVKRKGRFLTTGDVARTCHVTTNAVKKWIRERNLAAFKTPGGHFRIRAEDFDEFVTRYRMPVAGGARDGRAAKVLVVDDDADLLQLVTMALSEPALGLAVETASDGYEALIAIGRLRPDLLILDLKMPRVDGIEVCRRLRSDPETERIAIVVMTGFPARQDVKRLKQWGIEEILAKPFAIQDLLGCVERLLPGGEGTGPIITQV